LSPTCKFGFDLNSFGDNIARVQRSMAMVSYTHWGGDATC